MATEQERIIELRKELHQHNYNYYVLNAPQIDDLPSIHCCTSYKA